MNQIDLTKASAHFIVDRKDRIEIIEKTVGWGEPIAEAKDKKDRDATAILTSTGVIVVRAFDGMIITAFVATVRQAQAVWSRATGTTAMPRTLWNIINYNNNTTYWRMKVAA